jgi:hypothetical protein
MQTYHKRKKWLPYPHIEKEGNEIGGRKAGRVITEPH